MPEPEPDPMTVIAADLHALMHDVMDAVEPEAYVSLLPAFAAIAGVLPPGTPWPTAPMPRRRPSAAPAFPGEE